jgi:hypothetical protein
MANRRAYIRVEGVREVIRAIGKVEPGLKKELGQRNKAIGARIIERSYPKPLNVGAGLGAKPRPSAAANVLRIIAGGSHRTRRAQQWGRRNVPRDIKRPFIRLAAEKDIGRIASDYLNAVLEVARKAGIKTRRGF